MKNTYFIGGSPCSGKSTAAEILSREYGLYYFKVDDFLEKYMELGAQDGLPLCKKIAGMSAEQIWMREAQLQCREEFGIYEEIFDYILADLDQLNSANGILTEGAAYVPRLFKRLGLPGGRYIAVTPTPEFQIDHYRQRAFVPYVLADCPDKEQAFRNWMDRDILFAQEVRRQCREEGYSVIINDGSIPMDEMAGSIAAHFGLRTCIHNRGMLDGRGFFPSDKEIFRSNPVGLQGKATQYGGKKTGQTAFNGCEYMF